MEFQFPSRQKWDAVAGGSFMFRILVSDGNRRAEVVRKNGANYIPLRNGQEYRIQLVNGGYTEADADVKIDGEMIGKFRVPAQSDIVIERPADDRKARKFVFAAEKSGLAREAGVMTGMEENGLVEVTFVPEKERVVYTSASIQPSRYSATPSSSRFETKSMAAPASAAPRMMQQMNAGATVLGDYSDQKFQRTREITVIDYARVVTLVARLVEAREDYPRPRPRPVALTRAYGTGEYDRYNRYPRRPDDFDDMDDYPFLDVFAFLQ